MRLENCLDDDIYQFLILMMGELCVLGMLDRSSFMEELMLRKKLIDLGGFIG